MQKKVYLFCVIQYKLYNSSSFLQLHFHMWCGRHLNRDYQQGQHEALLNFLVNLSF